MSNNLLLQPQVLSRQKLVRLKKELRTIVEWAGAHPDALTDIDLLCRQAEIGRQCLRNHNGKKRG